MFLRETVILPHLLDPWGAAIYAAAFVQPSASLALYVVVAMIWFIPDRRVERTLDTV